MMAATSARATRRAGCGSTCGSRRAHLGAGRARRPWARDRILRASASNRAARLSREPVPRRAPRLLSHLPGLARSRADGHRFMTDVVWRLSSRTSSRRWTGCPRRAASRSWTRHRPAQRRLCARQGASCRAGRACARPARGGMVGVRSHRTGPIVMNIAREGKSPPDQPRVRARESGGFRHRTALVRRRPLRPTTWRTTGRGLPAGRRRGQYRTLYPPWSPEPILVLAHSRSSLIPAGGGFPQGSCKVGESCASPLAWSRKGGWKGVRSCVVGERRYPVRQRPT